MPRIVTFGEIMGRLCPPGFLRFRQAMPGDLNLTFAGAEVNVAASCSLLGNEAVFVTALPDNPVSDACIASLKTLGIQTDHIVKSKEGRLGLYFVEAGANQRPSRVVYDRDYAAVSLLDESYYAWDRIFSGADWFHITGITPSLSEIAAGVTIYAVESARKSGLKVSCDLNFRNKLWNWKKGVDRRALARQTMHKVLPFVDLVIANEEDAGDVLGIHAADTDVQAGTIHADRYTDVARRIHQQYPNVGKVAITLRESLSASHNNWGAMLYDCVQDTACFAPEFDGEYTPYEIRNIVDRVGGGDAFAAGLITALNDRALCDPVDAIRFAVAASCLAHSVYGDFNYSTRDEVLALVGGSASGRVVR